MDIRNVDDATTREMRTTFSDTHRTAPDRPASDAGESDADAGRVAAASSKRRPHSRRMSFANTPADAFDGTQPRKWRFRRTPRWRYFYVMSLFTCDVVAMLLALTIGLAINPQAYDTLVDVSPLLLFLTMLSIVWIFSLAFVGAYRRHVMAEGYSLYTKIMNATVFTIIISSAAAFMAGWNLPRTALIYTPLIAGVLETVFRWILRRSLYRNRVKNRCRYNTVLVGSPEGLDRFLHTLDRFAALGYSPIAVCPIALKPDSADEVVSVPFTPSSDVNVRDLKVLTFNSNLARTAEYLGAQSVMVTDVLSRDSQLLHALSLSVESLGLELALPVSLADVAGHRLNFRNVAEQPMLTARLPQYSRLTYAFKRVLDIVLSAFAIIISSPIMLAVAILIKVDDGGPIFFKQTRIGLHGIPFTMYKFRSMVVNAEELKSKLAKEYGKENRFIFKLKDDPRITKIGHFIRKTSLDEFPQFFNVFKGDMSMVGPRPALPEEVRRYGYLYSTRLLVKPGITGPWQISGRSDLSKEESEYRDVSYIENWSITGDLVILLKTVGVILHGTGAY